MSRQVLGAFQLVLIRQGFMMRKAGSDRAQATSTAKRSGQPNIFPQCGQNNPMLDDDPNKFGIQFGARVFDFWIYRHVPETSTAEQ